MARRTARRRHQKRKAQHGGGWGYDSVAGVSAAGAPFESRTPYDHCYSDPRAVMAPNVNPIGAMQSGGACGCMAQPPLQSGGGSGTGGYGFTLSNDLGKVYSDITRGSCPTSVQTGGVQTGGGPGLPAEIANSYSAGYGFGPAGVVQSSSATYLDRSDYGRTCQGGGRRSTKKSRKARRRSRKGRKTGRRHH
jgi:hypothetical protein